MLAWLFVVLQEIRTSIAKKSYIFVIFQGWGGGGPDPTLNAGLVVCGFKGD